MFLLIRQVTDYILLPESRFGLRRRADVRWWRCRRRSKASEFPDRKRTLLEPIGEVFILGQTRTLFVYNRSFHMTNIAQIL